MTVFDWLEGVALPQGTVPVDIVELRFKANRKGFYRKPEGTELQVGDVVVVETETGEDVGVVSLRGELVRNQMRAKKIREDHEVKRIVRRATQEDIDRWQQARMREPSTIQDGRQIIQGLGIPMKLTDVEFQGDGRKATFYYTAEDRVDFRVLVRELAGAFGIRVEMRQIGARQEAARIGGIGVCGRELCCSSWLTDFRSVSTSAARYQQLSLNPQKLAGQCGKLKCCLNYELDQYVEAVKDFPSPNTKVKLKEGKAVVFKMDIFKRLVYLLPLDEPGASPVPISVEDMQELMAMNERGEFPTSLAEFVIEQEPDEVDALYANVVGQDSLTRFDERRKRNRGGKGRRPGGGDRGPRPEGGAPRGDRGPRPEGGAPRGDRGPRPEGGAPRGDRGPRPEGGTPRGDRGPRPNRPNRPSNSSTPSSNA